MISKTQELELKRQLMALTNASRYEEAENLARNMLSHLSEDMELWFAYAQINMALGRTKDSAVAYMRAAQKPSSLRQRSLAFAADMCEQAGLFELGVQAARYLVQLEENSASANFKAGFFAWQCQLVDEALRFMNKAVELEPDNSSFWMQLGQTYVHLGRIQEALNCFERAETLDDDNIDARVRWLYVSNYLEECPESNLFQAHRDFGEQLEARYPSYAFDTDPLEGRRLRIAYLSKDFCAHAVASFFIPLLAGHDRSSMEIFCYSDVPRPDEITERIKNDAEHWKDVSGLSDVDLCTTIRSDKIDVLVDLAGYAGGNRMNVFAMQAAPVQVNYLGYPNTSGCLRMSHRVTDELCDPTGDSDPFYTEELERLPNGFLCYQSLNLDVEESRPPVTENGFVTFGSFNVYPKLQPNILNAWAAILQELPNAKLYLKAKPFSEPSWRDLMKKRFLAKGVKEHQLIFSGRSRTYGEHLYEYSKVDIHLDTHPYNGTTTTCDALWMGVPTLSLRGAVHRARVSASIMERVGRRELIADDLDDYVKKAIALGNDLAKVEALRSGNRDRFLRSPLASGDLIARDLEAFYQRALEEQAR